MRQPKLGAASGTADPQNRGIQGNSSGLQVPLLLGDSGNDDDLDAGVQRQDGVDGVPMREKHMLGVTFADEAGYGLDPFTRRSSAPDNLPKDFDDAPVHLPILAAISKTSKEAGSLRAVSQGVEAIPTMSGDGVSDSLRDLGFRSLLQLIPTDPDKVGQFAICEATSSDRLPLTHHRLLGFLRYEIDLFKFGITVHDRCAILLPNGPELAVCLLLCLSRCTCVPINHQQTPSEVRALLQGTEARALIVLKDEEDERVQEVVQDLDIEVLSLKPSGSFQGLFTLSHRSGPSLAPCGDETEEERGWSRAAAKLVSKSLPARPDSVPQQEGHGGVLDVDAEMKEAKGSRRRWRAGEGALKGGGGYLSRARQQLQVNGPADEALILHTSGTSAACKRVPYSLETLVVGASCIAASWGLGPADVCFNMMPLFHVGGIARNVLAPILAGGGVVCAPMLDPALFWESLAARGVTWYYAGPTMHQMILEEMPHHPEVLNVNRGDASLRFVANASGGLSEALAERMHSAFGCPVLPCYGMTECMPVSSPPLRYPVLHPASSGQVVGPLVRILGGDGQWLGAGEVGEVVLKGAPVIRGYEGAGAEAANLRGYTEGGWFRTGDMGMLQAGGWLTLTGRCKEVINRGGELISPLEVEEVVVRHPMVREVMAFSCPHSVLQEVVGVAIVSQPLGPNQDGLSERRVDLSSLQRFVSESLHPSKWPQVIVYLDKLPKGNAMKVQRIGAAERMQLAPLTDGEGQAMRLFEGEGPEPGAPLQQRIEIRRVAFDADAVTKAVRDISRRIGLTESAAISSPVPGEKGGLGILLYVSPASLDPFMIKETLRPWLHDYLLPLHVIALEQIPADAALLPAPKPGRDMEGGQYNPRTETERKMQLLWGGLLGKEVGIESDFFHSGGNSLLAGRLVAQVRAVFAVPMTAATLFKHRTVASLSELTESLLEVAATGNQAASNACSLGKGISGSQLSLYGRGRGYFPWWEIKEAEGKTRSQCRLAALVVQALPLTVLYPLRRVVTWTVFISLWLFLLAQVKMNRLLALIVALAAARVVAEVAFPILFLLCKWIIIGRYRAGRYPLWGQYYLRWWFVEKLQQLCGRGIFRHTNWSLVLYYRLLGAKIGKNVRIDPRAYVSEYDLIEIGSGSAIDQVRVSAFVVDQYAMVLEPLVVGERCSVPCKVSLVPGIVVPPDTAFGPLSSSYEIGDGSTTHGPDEGFDGNARYCRQRFPEPAWYLKLPGYLVVVVVWLVEQVPVLIVLRLIVIFPWYMKEISTYVDVLRWFLTPERIGYYVALRVLRTTALPLLRVAMCIVVKRVLIGKFTEGPRERSQWYKFKHWLMARLLPGEKLQEAAHLVGAHYEGVSVILRCLGAKVGKRIYWPGTGLQGLVEYDLLEVGDDVVFGSRTNVMVCDAVSSKRIRILAGANVGDRCVLLPGCTIGKNALLGSGGLGGPGQVLRANSKWVGSQGGAAVLLDAGPEGEGDEEEGAGGGGEDTVRPFGKAMYKGLAPYVVLPGWFHGAFTAVTRSVAASWRALTLIAAFEITRLWLRGGAAFISQPVTLWGIAERITPLFFVAHNAATLLALLVAWACKWALMGKRRPGEFDWDKSSYCQRWQLYLSLTGIIRSAYFGEGVLDLLHGSAYLVWWFRSLGAQIGREVCLYPRGADPMMTEPDLVQIGHFACVDSASVIAHINSRGHFALNAITVGPGANLRADSRLLSGAAMMPGSTLLEHTLVLGGDVVDEGGTWQGWPGQVVVPQTPAALTPSHSRDSHMDALDQA